MSNSSCLFKKNDYIMHKHNKKLYFVIAIGAQGEPNRVVLRDEELDEAGLTVLSAHRIDEINRDYTTASPDTHKVLYGDDDIKNRTNSKK